MATGKAARMPSLIYGTAWKADGTRVLVEQAISNGFRGIDTAAQPKHYQEHLVGAGIRDAIEAGKTRREDLYLQTKYTSVSGQDPRQMPYDPKSSLADQVNASVASSLHNLRHNTGHASSPAYLDCLVLHSPLSTMARTQEAWRAMETHVPHAVRTLGISNCYDLPVLQALYDSATVKPSVVQNRFYADTAYDPDIRHFCNEKGVVYQTFWTLTANPRLLKSEPVAFVADRVNVSRAVALYALVLGLGNVRILNGTKNPSTMAEDLAGVEAVKGWSATQRSDWDKALEAFTSLLR
ncbi:uncharacterized protein MYCFIDRAFT_85270 [Pseudocercospora fijiensis CIRAD86]|uniref:NADP-dependent oxidoreductase domain-containing protein n=1 Tax=Pseudocercospora fijiensis (strain CIRAD86) TaxID=383855 RepID=M2Z5Z7_PSEFD|nr:uncharacterized protein MYCFIDRAFT_85270 [Pseudocercospora fijiensis CIRAD86]EME85205.1 hypothetical protein MYCFIDRAFT_85270 [Pseudocercospora fijiensis CIRAD86]